MSKKTNFFWASYADLMTSLFFIMLVLFVLTIAMMKRQQKATVEQLKRIVEIQNSVKELDKRYFYYQDEYKRFSLKKQIQFDPAKSTIKPEYKEYLLEVGRNIESLIKRLQTKYQNNDIKYMIIIEGMSSNDNYKYNDELSYQRALSLLKLWNQSSIYFDPTFCELQIAGSGTKGVGRFEGIKNEYKNQQFLIQIIPKIGKIEN
ncbi:outer membrane protein OmpA-like peptidoglycan-associated protein [Flavobacterium sp. CG_23.5]|uniref:OmpA family protein n=1 Tax=Flavobacterium sp. CG_23.5 TaxID=2760708 RepID=UPI001AE99B50|nr:OmpA family protein [Flavobacterium sp. CG_23.5]MBP2281701.1 outer membrane protein OmpA-like peptidoglycan-associated protein [Flavobacterium sp. CG_23.5]